MSARRIRWLALALGVALALPSFAEPAPGGADASKERIGRLLKALGADDAKARERATKELERIGDPAVPALRDAARSDDPEVAWRARTILDHIDAAGEAPESGAASGRGSLDFARDKSGQGPSTPLEAGRTEARPGPSGGTGASRLHSFNFRIDPGASNGSVIITQDGTGRLSVTVTEDENGRRTTKTYEAEGAEAFKQKYPDIAKKYGIGDAGRAPRVLRDFVPGGGLGRLLDDFKLDEDFLGRDWPQGFGEDIDRLHDQLRRQMDDVFRRHHLDAWGDRFMQRFRDRLGDEAPSGNAPPRGDPPAEAPDTDRAPRSAERPPAPPGTLGIRLGEVPPALRDQLKLGDLEGVLIEDVLPDSRAERGGFKAHDVVTRVNGTPVRGPWELRRVLREEQAKDAAGALEFGIIRGGEKRTLKVTTAE